VGLLFRWLRPGKQKARFLQQEQALVLYACNAPILPMAMRTATTAMGGSATTSMGSCAAATV
jgi:hypothetical protein